MDINLSISAAPGITTDYLVVAIYEATAPSTLVASQGFAAPHTSFQNIVFPGVNPVPHIVIVYQTPTNTASGTIRHRFMYDPSYQSAQIRLDMFLVADSTPGFSSTGISYTDATLIGWTFSNERRGFGTMQPGNDYSYDATTGTWTLLATIDNPTPSIAPGEMFILHFQPKIVTLVPVVNSANIISDSYDITADISLDVTHMGKCGLIAGSGDHLTVTLPALSTIPDNKLLFLISQGGSHINATIKSFGSDSIKFLGGSPVSIIMGQCERLWMFKKNGFWNVLSADGNFKTVGEVFDSYSNDTSVILNAIFANGGTISRVTFARITDYVTNKLDPSQVVNDADWNNPALKNKGKWSTGDGSTTIRVPLLYKTVDGSNNILSSGFLEGVDGTTLKAGVFSPTLMIDHRHSQTLGTLPTSIWSKLLTSLISIGTAIGNYYRTGTNTGTDLTSSPCKTDGSAFLSVGNENKPTSTAIYKMIRI
jgi:hypothetical protein